MSCNATSMHESQSPSAVLLKKQWIITSLSASVCVPAMPQNVTERWMYGDAELSHGACCGPSGERRHTSHGFTWGSGPRVVLWPGRRANLAGAQRTNDKPRTARAGPLCGPDDARAWQACKPRRSNEASKTRRATTRLQPVRVLLADKEWHHHAVRRHARERPRTLGHLPVGRRVLVDLHRWWTR